MRTAQKNTMQEFKSLLRMNDLKYDPWGTAVSAWFDCAAHLYEKGDCPKEWQYRPGAMGNRVEPDSSFFEMFTEMEAEQLEEIGQLLCRYTKLLKRHGHDY